MEEESAYFQPMASDDQVFVMPPSETQFFSYGEEPQYLGDMDTTEAAAENPEVTMNDAAIILAPPSAVVLAEPVSEEMSPMAKWNSEWQVTLKERKDEENKQAAEDAEKARIDLENFEKERLARIDAKQKKNRVDETENLEAIQSDLANDNSWQKVVKLVELSHDDKSSDCGRMRDIFISLKNDPVRATALA